MRELPEPVFATDAPAPNAVSVVQQLIHRLDRHRAGIVDFALRLLDDDLELSRELVGIDRRAAVCVRLDVERLDEPARRNHSVVQRVIVDRRGVQIAADRLRLPRDLSHATAWRALEVHVLEHMRDAHDIVGLVEVAGGHVRHDRRYRRARVAPHEYAQAVRQSPPANRCWIDERHVRNQDVPSGRLRITTIPSTKQRRP